MKKLLIIFGAFLAILMLGYLFIAFFLPLPYYFFNPTQKATTKIFDRNGILLYEILDPASGKRSKVPLSRIPDHVKNATLAAEDVNFYWHPGVDAVALFRALFLNLREGRVVSGASTITQQLARNMEGAHGERGITRKLWEMAYALRLSQVYTKDQILEMYLNRIYYGNLAYGVESAALDYFGKHVYDLDLAESSLLSGLPQSPSYYNPFENLKGARKRQAYVLDQMVKHGFIFENEANEAKAEKLQFRSNRVEMNAPHFVQYIIGKLEAKYGERTLHYGGLNVTTTLDYNLQTKAENVIGRQIEKLKSKDVGSAALLAVDVKNGQILAWVGSADYFDESIDGAVDMITSLRQPGSSIKPFTYLAAFEKGWTSATTIADIPTQFQTSSGPYTPKNYDLKFHGLVRARTALASSYNVPAVKTLEFVGVPVLIDFLKRFGIGTMNENPDFYGLALTLGGGEVSPKAMAQGYLAIANLGAKKELSDILKITDAEGGVLEEWQANKGENILGPRGRQNAYQIIDILSDNMARIPGFGEGSVLELSRPAAVKTGTTRNFRDNWTIGFTPQLLSVVWAGNADGRPMTNISGVDGAGPIWHDFMEQALSSSPRLNFESPGGLKEVEICALSGKLPTPHCQNRIFEIFANGREPREKDNIYQLIMVDKLRGFRVTDECLKKDPSITYEEKLFEVYPPELKKWAMTQGIPEPPRESCEHFYGITGAGTNQGDDEAGAIIHPLSGDSFLFEPTIPIENQKIPFQIIVPDDVTAVDWWLDGRKVAGQKEYPFSFMWEMEAGKHNLYAVMKGNTEKNTITVRFEVK